MKKAILFIILLNLSFSIYADSFSGWYEFNSNNYAGVMNINLDGNSLSGIWYVLTNPVTGTEHVAMSTMTNTEVTYGIDWYNKKTIKITFQPEGDNQVFTGWISWDRKIISGYFTNGSYEFPWYAKKL